MTATGLCRKCNNAPVSGRGVVRVAVQTKPAEICTHYTGQPRPLTLNQYQAGMCISGVLKTAERTTRYLISPLGPNWVGTDIAV